MKQGIKKRLEKLETQQQPEEKPIRVLVATAGEWDRLFNACPEARKNANNATGPLTQIRITLVSPEAHPENSGNMRSLEEMKAYYFANPEDDS